MALLLTPSAAKRIAVLIAEEKGEDAPMFRVMVTGGGCSGYQYNFSLDSMCHLDDHVFDDQGVKVVIDEASLPFIENAELDYVEELIGASFQIKNPNAQASCGCGNSFSV